MIYEYVFDSALVVVSTVENFGVDLLGRVAACTSPYNLNGIPKEVFPCLATVDRHRRVILELPKTWFGYDYRYRNLPYEKGQKLVDYQGFKFLNSNLLFTCRQIAKEFAPILYSRTALAFGSSKALQKFMTTQDWLAHL